MDGWDGIGWMDGWDGIGWMDGWMDGWLDGWMDGWDVIEWNEIGGSCNGLTGLSVQGFRRAISWAV